MALVVGVLRLQEVLGELRAAEEVELPGAAGDAAEYWEANGLPPVVLHLMELAHQLQMLFWTVPGEGLERMKVPGFKNVREALSAVWSLGEHATGQVVFATKVSLGSLRSTYTVRLKDWEDAMHPRGSLPRLRTEVDLYLILVLDALGLLEGTQGRVLDKLKSAPRRPLRDFAKDLLEYLRTSVFPFLVPKEKHARKTRRRRGEHRE